MSTLVFGHKNPDTDSVCSSIAYAYYKQKIGEIVEPRILGPLRREAKFVLDYFKVKEPSILQDVKVEARDLNYDKIVPLTTHSSVYEAYMNMENDKIHTLPIVDDNNKLIGLVSIKDIAYALIHINDDIVATSIQSIANVFAEYSPKIIIYTAQNYINGTLKVFNPSVPQDMKIDDDNVIILKHYHRQKFFDLLDKQIPLLILAGFDDISYEEKNILQKHNITTISINISAPMIIKKIHQTDSIASIMRKDKIYSFTLKDDMHDIKDTMLKTNYRNYPLVDETNNYIGLLGRKHLLNPGRKKVILVDHNEFSQSANGIQEAHILEIVDHHKIGGINTNEPIQFMNMPVGSTCTIVYEIFKNSNIQIPYNMAGLLISGILSDTLYFKSPTCTRKDISAVYELNEITNLNLDEYTTNMFKVGSSIEGMSLKDILYNDFKEFEIKNNKIAISQLFTMDIDEIETKKEELLEYMNSLVKINDYNTLIFVVTDILQEGSYFYYVSDDEDIVSRAFDCEDTQGVFVKMIVSRKKQIIPMIISELEAY